jgi:hypothetical protein
LSLTVYLGRKNKLQNDDLYFALDMITLMKFVNSQINYKQQHVLERVLDYMVELINFASPKITDPELMLGEIIDAIVDDTTAFCLEEGIEVDADLEAIIKMVAQYVASFWMQ